MPTFRELPGEQREVLSTIRELKIEQAKNRVRELTDSKKKRFVEASTKWDEFRVQRNDAIQEFYVVRRRIVLTTRVIAGMKMWRILSDIMAAIRKERARRRRMFSIVMKLFLYQKRFLKVGMDDRHEKHLKYTITSTAFQMNELMTERAMDKTLVPFLQLALGMYQ